MKYKFYSTHRLRDLLDSNTLTDHRLEQNIRAVLLYRFLRDRGANCLSIGSTDDDQQFVDEPYFSRSGCACCSNGMGNDVYQTIGYSSKNGVIDLGEVCHDCVCVSYNGVDHVAHT